MLNTEIRTILAEKSGEISTTSAEDADLRAERAKEEGTPAVLLGFLPSLEAFKVFPTALDVPASSISRTGDILKESNELFWKVVGIVRNSDDYSESKAAIANLSNLAKDGASAEIRGLFDGMLSGTAVIPEEAKDVIARVKAQATSQLLAGVAAVIKQLDILAEAIFNAGTRDDVENYSHKIAAAQEEALEYLNLEVINKVSVQRNLVIADYPNKNGIVSGLFALQSASGNRFL